MIARVVEDTSHSQFLSYDAGSHLGLLQLDFYVDAGRKVELHKSIDCLRRRIDDIEQTFMGADLELFTRLLVHMGLTQNGEFLDTRGKRDRSANLCTGSFGSSHDLARRLVEHAMIEGFQPYPNMLTVHCGIPSK